LVNPDRRPPLSSELRRLYGSPLPVWIRTRFRFLSSGGRQLMAYEASKLALPSRRPPRFGKFAAPPLSAEAPRADSRRGWTEGAKAGRKSHRRFRCNSTGASQTQPGLVLTRIGSSIFSPFCYMPRPRVVTGIGSQNTIGSGS
jgi:hypothetical protein